MNLRIANYELQMQPKRTALRSVAHSSFEIRHSVFSSAFTLIELILIMAVIAISASLIVPRLANFFRGRIIDSETRQIIALIHQGQSRAVSAGVPTLLWFDEKAGAYGLEEEPGFTDKDNDAVEFALDKDLQFQIPNNGPSATIPTPVAASGAHANLPQIRFLPDGTIGETSPKLIRLLNRDGSAVSLTQSRDRNQYETQSATTQWNATGS
jgi:type II secretory pathway pseudopilin PulG